jgi:digeranylgeranylglycerophospholipid reductase
MLVGDAARQIDPLTGGGVANACKAGKVAGELAARVAKTGDASKEVLMEYDRGWREIMENQLIRNFLAKDKFLSLSDDTFNKLASLLGEIDLKRVTTHEILKAVTEKYPEVAEEFGDLL